MRTCTKLYVLTNDTKTLIIIYFLCEQKLKSILAGKATFQYYILLSINEEEERKKENSIKNFLNFQLLLSVTCS